MNRVALRRAIVCGFCTSLMGTAPAEARFLQVDPIGYQDQNNLYAYVRNDPLNQVDPRGTDAIVLLRENGNVDIILPIAFSGDAATSQNIAAAMRNIQSAWTGNVDGTNVTMTVVQGTSSLDPSVRNTMVITSGNTSKLDPAGGTQGHSFVNNGRTGEVTTRDVNRRGISQPDGTRTVSEKGRNTYAHEGGHLSGAPDRSGPGLMGPGRSSAPTGADIAAIRQTNTPTGAVNTIVNCSEDDRC